MKQFDKLPERIISLVPSLTELLYDLGLDQEVIGITKFCVHPGHWFRQKTRIGGTKTVNIAKVKALEPDLVIANKEENVKEQVEALRQFTQVYISDIHTADEALRTIADIGSLTGKLQTAELLRKDIIQNFARLQQGPSYKVVYCIWRSPWMTAGGDTFIHDMLCRAGWRNIHAHRKRYPSTSLQELAAARPDIVFLSSEPFPFGEKHIREVQAALPDARIMLVDGEMFSWYGSRMRYAPAYLQELIRKIG